MAAGASGFGVQFGVSKYGYMSDMSCADLVCDLFIVSVHVVYDTHGCTVSQIAETAAIRSSSGV